MICIRKDIKTNDRAADSPIREEYTQEYLEELQKRWREEADKIEAEMEAFRISFAVMRKCDCPITDCRHFQRLENRAFKKRLKAFLDAKFRIGVAQLDFAVVY